MPVPTIFLIDSNEQLVEMKAQLYDSEDRLQELLVSFPNVLAGDQMSDSTPVAVEVVGIKPSLEHD